MEKYKLIYFNSIDSTQNYAQYLINNNIIKEDTIIWAETQTNGRGTKGRKWKSPKGNLYVSYVLKIKKKDPKISYITAVSIIEALMYFGIRAQIKWPNDILINNSKCAGILIEYNSNYVIIGIGINIIHAPRVEYKTSRCIDYSNNINAQLVLQIITKFLNEYLYVDFNIIKEKWNKYGAYLNKEILYKEKKLIMLGINDCGELILKDKDNYYHVISNEIFL